MVILSISCSSLPSNYLRVARTVFNKTQAGDLECKIEANYTPTTLITIDEDTINTRTSDIDNSFNPSSAWQVRVLRYCIRSDSECSIGFCFGNRMIAQ